MMKQTGNSVTSSQEGKTSAIRGWRLVGRIILGMLALASLYVTFGGGDKAIRHAIWEYQCDHATFEFVHGKNNEKNSMHGTIGFLAGRSGDDSRDAFALSRSVVIGPFAEFPENVILNFDATSVRGIALALTEQNVRVIGSCRIDETNERRYWYSKDSDDQAIGIRTERYWDGYYLNIKLYENIGVLSGDEGEDDIAYHAIWDYYKSEVRRPDGCEIFNFSYEDGELVCESMK